MSTETDILLTKLIAAQDIHSAFTSEKFYLDGVDLHFNTRYYTSTTDYVGKTSDFWKRDNKDFYIGNGYISSNSSIYGVAIYSKGTYNTISVYTTLPSLDTNGQVVYIGFENGYQTGNGYCAFKLTRSAGTDKFYADCSGAWAGGTSNEITSALPSNYKTTRHIYTIFMFKSHAEFYIDNTLVTIGINASNLNVANIAYPPYGISKSNNSFSTEMTSLLEVTGIFTNISAAIDPERFRLGHINPDQARIFQLYETATSTKFSSKTLSSGTLTSHPFPVIGFSGKTIQFQANTNGTVLIQILTQTNTWRTYDSVSYAANTLLSYIMVGDAVLGRIQYTPTAYPAVIAEGEVNLR